MTGTVEYNAWSHMKRRCLDEKRKDYPYYGGRGIKFCERWESFENFFADMGHCPEGYSLDRKACNMDYYPENCSWESKHTQAVNRRIKSTNKSGRTGVHYDKRKKRWVATLCQRGEMHIVVCSSFEEAVAERERMEIEYRGEVRSKEYDNRINKSREQE